VAHHQSAIKRLRQNERRRLRNSARKTRCKTGIKKVLAAVEQKDVAGAESALREAVKLLDRTSARGIIHPNRAARNKSQLYKKLNMLRSGAAAESDA
jgi:small subunit ribosomal protein S20